MNLTISLFPEILLEDKKTKKSVDMCFIICIIEPIILGDFMFICYKIFSKYVSAMKKTPMWHNVYNLFILLIKISKARMPSVKTYVKMCTHPNFCIEKHFFYTEAIKQPFKLEGEKRCSMLTSG
jgi:hypothetical protein